MIHKTNPEKDHPWVGHYNDPPPNLSVISEDAFWAEFAGAYSPKFMFIKQVMRGLEDRPEFENRVDLTLWMMHGGRAIGWVRHVVQARAAKPRQFVECFECEHEMIAEETGMRFLHRSRCSKCGYVDEVDSS